MYQMAGSETDWGVSEALSLNNNKNTHQRGFLIFNLWLYNCRLNTKTWLVL